MAENTSIEWADHTFNPWFGCTKVSPGCDHCYAEARMDTRLHRVRWGAGEPRVRTKDWSGPERWNRQHEVFYAVHGRRQRVFCASLADVFDNQVDPAWRIDLFDLVRRCENLDFLLLTKRVGNVTPMLREIAELLRSEHGSQAERERGVSAGPLGPAGDRLGRPDLAAVEADLRPLDWRHEGDALSASARGAEDARRLLAGASDDRRKAALRGGGPAGLAALQGTDPSGAHGESRGRGEGPEPSGQPGTGDLQRAAPACGAGTGRRACRREGLQAPQGPGDGSGRCLDASAPGAGVAGEGHRGSLRDHAEVGVAYLHRQDLGARADLLAWVERWLAGDAPRNVWLGATVVNQEEADRDIPKLLATPARVRFLSMEPLLGPVTLRVRQSCGDCDPCIGGKPESCAAGSYFTFPEVDWVIVGGESGRGARPAQLQWVRSIVRQSQAAGVPVLVKQLGREVLDDGMSSPGEHWPAGMVRRPIPRREEVDPGFAMRLKHAKGGDWSEWPEDLRVRQFPEVRHA